MPPWFPQHGIPTVHAETDDLPSGFRVTVHSGNPPDYAIYPVHARALFWEGLDHPVAHVLHHPVTPPMYHARDAVPAAAAATTAAVTAAIEEVFSHGR